MGRKGPGIIHPPARVAREEQTYAFHHTGRRSLAETKIRWLRAFTPAQVRPIPLELQWSAASAGTQRAMQPHTIERNPRSGMAGRSDRGPA